MELKGSPENVKITPPVHGPVDEPNPVFENAIDKMRGFLCDVYRPAQVDRALFTRVTDAGELIMRAKIWTHTNEYNITATIREPIHRHDAPSNCLGGSATSRKSRSGETWHRGNDLHDGRFNEQTWDGILIGIVRYEAEEVKSERWKETHRPDTKNGE